MRPDSPADTDLHPRQAPLSIGKWDLCYNRDDMQSESPMHWRGREVVCGAGPFVWGILNVTPDSFSDGGAYATHEAAVAAACRMAREGADVIDVGGESTRPGAVDVTDDEQIARTSPVIAELARRFGPDGPAISIDTRSAAVARQALEAGATLVNDVSALRDDPALAEVVREYGAGIVLMHMKGTPRTMQHNPHYDDVIEEVSGFLAERVEFAVKAGIARSRIVIDPGIGFGKTTAHNLKILRNLERFRTLGAPVMVGPSRKRFIGETLGIDVPAERAAGTAGVVAAAVLAGVECVRVHDVLICRQAADICCAIREALSTPSEAPGA